MFLCGNNISKPYPVRKLWNLASMLCIYAGMENWDDLKFALAIHRHGGLSGAARAMGVNHSTVSRRLSGLENRMGVRLFDRFANGLTATAFGRHAIQTAEEMERHALDLELAIAGQDMELAGPLKVSAPQLIITVVLAEIFLEFAKEYPKINLTIVATSDAVNLHRREADVSILASNEPEGTLWGRKVLSQRCMYFAAKDYLASRRDEAPLNCINFIWRGDEPAQEVLKAYPDARTVAKFDDMVAVHGAVEAGMGIARMPCFLGDSTKGLQRVPNLEAQPYADIWVLTHPDLQKLPRVRTFMKFVSEALVDKKDLFMG